MTARLFVLIMSAYALAVLNSSVALARVVSGVTVEGVENKQGRLVRDIIEQNLTKDFNLDELEHVVEMIYNTGRFAGVDVFYDETPKGTEVIFKISPIRHIKSISFRGNTAFSASDLTNELAFSEGDGYSEDKVRNGVESIKKFYNLNGYLNAKVTADFVKLENGDLGMTVYVEQGAPCLVTEVSFRSVNSNLNKSLEKEFSDRLGKNFSQQLLSRLQDEINKKLFDDQYYSSTVLAPETIIDPAKTTVKLIYVINDPYMFALFFEGHGICDDLRTTSDQPCFSNSDIVRELKLDPSNRLSNSPLEDLLERLLRFYRRKGFAHVDVKYRENLFTKDFVRRITFTIASGPKVRIKDVVVEGAISRPSKYYKSLFFDLASDQLSSKLYVSEDIDGAVKNMIIDLQNQGFIAAKVTGTRTDFDKSGENATIRITLDEGPQTIVSQIDFNGVKSLSRTELEAVIGLQAGKPLHLGLLEDSTARIVELYRSKGYLDAQVTNSGKSIITYSNDNTRATLKFEIAEGPQVIVNGIVIEGNDFTKDYVIKRELQFHQGEVLTPDKITYSEQRLQRLSIFSVVDIHTLEEDPNQGNRTVLVKVQERDPGSFRFGVGINNDFSLTIKGFVGASYRNLFGTGRAINARVEVDDKTRFGFVENEVNLGYTEPFVFGTENTGRINLTRATRIYGTETKNGLEYVYATDTSQADALIERDLSRQLKLVWDLYGIARIDDFEINNYRGATSLNIASTGPTLLFDRRDDPFNPTRGDMTTLSFQLSTPAMGSTATVNFYKVTASYSKYIPLGSIVWANEIKGGYLKNISDDPNSAVPSIEAFVLGGRSTLRAFDPIKEQIPLLSEFPVQAPYPAIPGESNFQLVKSELRFPIYGNFGGAFFYDGGAVNIPAERTNPATGLPYAGFNPHFQWRDDVGVGLRYNTPVGPVSLEYAQKLNQDTRIDPNGNLVESSSYQILFSIGVF